jgi:16S rRNA (uracil1498-N3)-methyltransferase
MGLRLRLDLCPPRGDALDEAVDMAVQLGMDALRLVVSQRTLAVPDQGALSRERLGRRMREACRQCLRARVPRLEAPVGLAGALAEARPGERRLIMSERGGAALPALEPTEAARIIVGPEGGFSAAEIELALGSGWSAHSLGPHVLRVPTAVAAAFSGLKVLSSAPLRSLA